MATLTAIFDKIKKQWKSAHVYMLCRTAANIHSLSACIACTFSLTMPVNANLLDY